ncbi:MAG: hypothetical protein K2F74_01600, partial [Muribaculaceae bacterium]|nr:hypothetical protein [Muribaculaceae bacterium]
KYHRLGHSLALFSVLLSHSAKALLPQSPKKITQRLTALALTFIVEPALIGGQKSTERCFTTDTTRASYANIATTR